MLCERTGITQAVVGSREVGRLDSRCGEAKASPMLGQIKAGQDGRWAPSLGLGP